MPNRRGLLAAPTLVAVALAGCGGSTQTTTSPTTPGVELTEISAAGLDRVIAEQKGKVVLLDVWALS